MDMRMILVWVCMVAMAGSCLEAAEGPPGPAADSKAGEAPVAGPGAEGIWQGAVGDGFGRAAQSLSLEAGASRGMAVFGTRQQHDLALVSVSYGHILSQVRGQGHWYRGNWELRAELFGGPQFSPANEYLVGLAPHLRYDFATGTRWVPFVDLGAGVSLTGIRGPDLSSIFEFNLQAGGGVHWFLKDNLAVTLEVRLLHLSDAEMTSPNLGVNGVLGTVGVSRFF